MRPRLLQRCALVPDHRHWRASTCKAEPNHTSGPPQPPLLSATQAFQTALFFLPSSAVILHGRCLVLDMKLSSLKRLEAFNFNLAPSQTIASFYSGNPDFLDTEPGRATSPTSLPQHDTVRTWRHAWKFRPLLKRWRETHSLSSPPALHVHYLSRRPFAKSSKTLSAFRVTCFT